MEAIGPILLLTSIPLIFRWVPRNRFFGLRIPSTMASDEVWYEINAQSARHLFVLGLVLVGLEFVLPVSMRVLTLRYVATIGFFGIVAFDWRAANRLARQRHAGAGAVEHRAR